MDIAFIVHPGGVADGSTGKIEDLFDALQALAAFGQIHAFALADRADDLDRIQTGGLEGKFSELATRVEWHFQAGQAQAFHHERALWPRHAAFVAGTTDGGLQMHAVAMHRAAHAGFSTAQSRDGREGQRFTGSAFRAFFPACNLDARAGAVQFDFQILPRGDDIPGNASRAFKVTDLAAIQQDAVPLVGGRLGPSMQRQQQQHEGDCSEHCRNPAGKA